MKNYAAYSLFVSMCVGCGASSEEFGSIRSAVESDDESEIETSLGSPATDSESLLSSPNGGVLDEYSTFSGRSEAGPDLFPGLSLTDDHSYGYAAPVSDSVNMGNDGRFQPPTNQHDPHFFGVPAMIRTLSTMSYPPKYGSDHGDGSGFGMVYPERVRAVDGWHEAINELGLHSSPNDRSVKSEPGEDGSDLLTALEEEGICPPPLESDDEDETFPVATTTSHGAAGVKVEPDGHVKIEPEAGYGTQDRKRRGNETSSYWTANFHQDEAQAVKKQKLEGDDTERDSDGDEESYASSEDLESGRRVRKAVEYTTHADDDSAKHVHVERRWGVLFSLHDGKGRRLIQMVTIVDALGNRTTLAHGVDLAKVVERKSNISRMFGKYDSPSKKVKLSDFHFCDVSATHRKRTSPTNYLTALGVQQFLTHNKLIANPEYSAFINDHLLAREFGNGVASSAPDP